MTAVPAGVRRRYVDTSRGQVHLAECGNGEPVIFLHQTPRSWREYQEVLPLVARNVRAVAVDTIGFGQSDALTDAMSIEVFAGVLVEVLDALGLPSAHVVGHHTGGVVAVELAASEPTLVRSLVLSATPYVDASRRARVASRPPIDHVEPDAQGGHLTQLWMHRRGYYAPGEERFLDNYVADALATLDVVEDGHRAVNAYRMEERLPLVQAPVRLLCGADDEFSRPDLPALEQALGPRIAAPTAVIDRAGVALPEQRPVEFAAQVIDFVTSR
jgi:pimeloyl-ACP methyl ester carboxylesterase